ncbi:hypothetical protein EV175_000981 [Coemansia sp. RSA 1933]|nr:hypothetical protein EV175_000981 [Coemansia sp. RSA 1933]
MSNTKSSSTGTLDQHGDVASEAINAVSSAKSVATSDIQSQYQENLPVYQKKPRWWENKPMEDKPVDGPYGWAVVASSFLMLNFCMGCVNAYGSYQSYYHQNQFPDAPMSTLAWIGTLQFGVMNIFGILSGILCERFDTRIVTFIGGLIMGVSLIIASFCDSAPWKLIITQGIMFSIGASLTFIPSMSMPSQWFVKYRPLAVGIALSGSGIGGLWLAPATRAMIEHLGTGWALRITGIIAFVCVSVASLFMRNRTGVQAREKILDFAIFRDLRFNFLFAGTVCATAGYFTPLFDIPGFSKQVIGKSASFSNNLLTIVNAASTLGRLAAGQMTKFLGLINTLSLCTLGAAVSVLVFWLPFHSTGTIVVCVILFGFSCGGLISLLPLVMANTWGVERISTIIGLLYVACFIGTMVGAPSSGAILDNIGKGTAYNNTIIFSGVFMVLAFAFFALMRIATSRKPWAKF